MAQFGFAARLLEKFGFTAKLLLKHIEFEIKHFVFKHMRILVAQ